MEKECKTCKKVLDIESFRRNGKNHRHTCKECEKLERLKQSIAIGDDEKITDYGKRMVPSIDTAQRAIARFCLECGTGTFGKHCDACPLNAFSPRKCNSVAELHKLLK